MSLEKLLESRKSAILERWFDLILTTYPTDTQVFLKKKNRFSNPVAHEISQGIEGIFDQLLSEETTDQVTPFLERVIRVRAIQDLAPSKALSFIFDLKRLIREDFAGGIENGQIWEELWRVEQRIEDFGLLALDLYMKCREKIYELRIKEVKNRVGKLLQRADMICGTPGCEGDPEVCGTDNST